MGESNHTSANRTNTRSLVAKHPMIAFIVLAYAISWIAWLLDSRIDLGVVNGFGFIGSAGPALAAMIVTALQRPEPSGVPAGKRWRLFGLIGLLALAVMAARRLWITPPWLAVAGDVTADAAYPSLAALLVDVLAAAVAAFVFSGALSPRRGVRDLLRSLDPRWRPVRWTWWVIAMALYPTVIALGNALSAPLELGEPASVAAGNWTLLALDALLTYLILLLGGGGPEEPGWRGFALPTLLYFCLLCCVLTFAFTVLTCRKLVNRQLEDYQALKSSYQKLIRMDQIVRENFVYDIDEQYLSDYILAGYAYGLKNDYSYYLTEADFAKSSGISSGTVTGFGSPRKVNLASSPEPSPSQPSTST